MDTARKRTIVVIDDDFVLRQVIKSFLSQTLQRSKIYTAENGVEGLGFIISTAPDTIIIDTTLPKYSGRDLLEFITSNSRFAKTKVIVIHDGIKKQKLPKQYTVLNKNDNLFLEKLLKLVSGKKNISQTGLIIGTKVVRWANRGEEYTQKRIHSSGLRKLINTVLSLWAQGITNLYLLLMRLFVGLGKDAYGKQRSYDEAQLRIRTYPILSLGIVMIGLLVLQFGLAYIGGVRLFGTQIHSILAVGEGQVEVSLGQSEYNSESVEFIHGELRLKKQDLSDLVDQDEGELLVPEDGGDVLAEEPGSEEIGDSEQLTESNETDGVNEEPQVDQLDYLDHLDQQTQYTSEAQISFTQEIEYSKLVRFLELSSINDFNSSVELSTMSNEPTALSSQLTAHITYQLSPNNTDWYYYSATEARWEKTTNGYVSSNTVQEVNTHIESFDPEVGEEKSLFIRAYLHSDGQTQVTLKRLVVVRELQLITNTGDQLDHLDPKKGGISEFTVEKPESLTFIRPVILNAAYANGNKIISGRVELDEGVVIPDAELPNYSVTIYYTPDRDITAPAKDVDEEIGRADLQQITINNEIQYVFELKTPSSPGGYVTAQVCYGQCALGDELNAQRSQLSAPTENATLTVTETGDQSDASAGDGSCDHDGVTPGSQCTLRAAIEEANALAGADNIHFNIPDTDGNYLDYDNQTPGSNSGDGVGGDDFWTIQPGSALPNITEGVTLDGSTQTSNQGDHNTEGPEVELNGQSAGSVDGLYIQSAVTSGSIEDIVVNNWDDGIYIRGDNVTISNSYIGTDVTSDLAKTNTTGITIFEGAANTRIEENVISGNNTFAFHSSGIYLLQASDVEIRDNIIGLNKDQTIAVANYSGIFYRNSTATLKQNITIGGNSSIDRNVIAGNFRRNIFYDFPNTVATRGDVDNFLIKNNILGTSDDESFSATTFYNFGMNTTENDHDLDLLIEDNVFAHSLFTSALLTSCKGLVFRENEVYGSGGDAVATYYTEENTQDQTYPNSNPGNGPLDNEIIIESNHIRDNTGAGINNNGGSPIIQGNLIENNNFYGIWNQTPSHQTQISRLQALDPTQVWISPHYLYSRPIIGGTGALASSQCNGIEANCIRNNTSGGIASLDTIPWNESTLFSDNVLENNNDRAIEQTWVGIYEIFSNDIRRTDLTDETVTLDLPQGVKENSDPSTALTELDNYSRACLEAVDCLDQGIADSSGRTAFFNTSNSLPRVWDWPEIVEYIIDDSGTKVDMSVHQFDQDHVASGQFSFDGDSSTHPVTTGALRTKTFAGISQDFYDRGEPWTDTVTADRNIQNVTPNGLGWYEYPFGSYQMMEVEFVDANPVLQDDGSYIITVDSTTNEDNVSSSGYDDGGGAYSGGGNEGPDGLPDGSTSLLEAIYVANQHAGVDYIHFDIPVDDPSHVCYQDDGVSGQVSSGNIVSTTTEDDPTCGGTQIDPDHPYSWFDLSTTGTHTLTGPTIIDGYSQDGASKNTAAMGETLNHIIKIDTGDTTFDLDGGNSEITGIAMSDGGASIDLNSVNNHIWGIFLGVDVSGLQATGVNHGIDVHAINNVIGSDLDGSNDTAESNLLNHAFNCAYPGVITDWRFIDIVDANASNTVIANNYFNTDKSASATTGLFRGYITIDPNNITIGTPKTGIEIRNNLIVNNHVGVGSSFGNIFSSVEYNIINNRFNTDWSGTVVLNNHCPYAGNLLTAFVYPINHNNGGFEGFTGEISYNIARGYDFYQHPFIGGGTIIRKNRIGFLPIGDNLTVTNNDFEGGFLLYGTSFAPDPREANNLLFANNIIRDSEESDLKLEFVFNSEIRDNVFLGCRYNSSGFTYGSLSLDNSSNNLVTGNAINQDLTGQGVGPSDCTSQIRVSSNSSGNTIRDNVIYPASSSTATIDLSLAGSYTDGDGITANDDGDSDSGPNDLQNYPVITKVEYLGAGQYRISGDLDENSSEAPFDIEICESYDHPSNHGGCIQTLGHVTAHSPWQTIVEIPGDDGTQNRIFSTLATNTNGSTSEFSENFNIIDIVTYEIELVYPINGIQIDDRTPQLDWNPAVETATGYLDPDIHHYEVYLDGSYYGSTIDATPSTGSGPATELQLNAPLSLGSHTWEVVAFRQLGDGSFVETARSTVESFEIINPNYSFEPIYPVDVTIDDTTPLFDWSDLDPSSDFDSYDLYIDGELVAEGITESNYQLEITNELEQGSHEWYVVAVRIEPDGSRTEVGRTDIAEFEIFIPVEPPVTGDPSTSSGQGEDVEEDDDHRSSLINRIVPILPITGVLTIGFISMLAFGFAGSLNDLFLNLGFLIGIVYRRKKKYWGIVFDEQSSEPIPFAIIRLFKDGRLVKQTVSDLEGRYALIAEENGTYTIESKANGYQPYTKDISYSDAVDVVEDIPLLKTNQKVFFLKRLINHRKTDLIRYLKYGLVGLMVLGFFYTLYVTFRSPHIINFILLGIYALLFFLNALEILRYLSRKSGRVEEIKSKKGVGGVSVRIYQAGKQLDVVLSNVKGVIKFNLKPGIYRFLAHKSGYEMATEQRGRGVKRELTSKGDMEKSIKMKQMTKNKEQRASDSERDITPFGTV